MRLIFPFSPGSPAAMAMRATTEVMGTALNETIFLDAHPGGSGIIGLGAGVKSAPDGRTLTTVAQHVNTLPLLHGVDTTAFGAPIRDADDHTIMVLTMISNAKRLAADRQGPAIAQLLRGCAEISQARV